MDARIYLNGNLIDTYDKPITRKLQVNDVGDVSKSKSTFSYTIKFPRTSKNTAILEMLGVIGNTSRKPYELISCNYVVDSIPLITNGSAIIKDTGGKDYSMNIIDGFRSIVDALGSKKINELPLSDLDHVLSAQSVADSFGNTEGYIYALADFGLGLDSAVKVEKLAPSVYVHTIFNRIFTANNFVLSGDFFQNNQDYLTELASAGKGYEVLDQEGSYVSKGSDNLTTVNRRYINESEPLETILIQIPLDQGSFQDVTATDGSLVFNNADRYRLRLTGYYSAVGGNLYISGYVNGNLISVHELSEHAGKTYSVDFGLNAEVGDVLTIYYQVKSSTEQEEPPYIVDMILSNGLASLSLMLGQVITPGLYLGDIKQIDFIKDVIQRYGLILNPIPDSNQFNIKQIDNVYRDTNNAEDWSNKVSGVIPESYKSGYAQVNEAKYKYPETIPVPNNDGELLVNDLNAQATKPLFSSVFGIPALSDATIVDRLYYIPIWKDSGGEIDNEEIDAKLMRIKLVDTPITLQLYDIAGVVNVSEDIPILNLENISMQYYIDKYYEMFSLMLNDYTAITASIFLSPIDIYNLDFFKLKYLKQTGKYYYLNSVQNTTGKNSKVKMIEIVFPNT